MARDGLPTPPNLASARARSTAVGQNPTADSRSDDALLAAMALDDEAAGVAFVRRYQRRVFGMAHSIVNDPSIAEEVAQEALIRVWRHAPVFDARRGSVSTWVLTITRNLAIDALRLRRAVPIDPDDLVALGRTTTDPDPADVASRTDSTALVRNALGGLPPEQRRALLMSAFFGLTAEEISRREGVPLGTAKTRIRTGLHRVRAILAASGHLESLMEGGTQ
jgi:RNA polymerase sigma-70 factor (ECF subfamily)